MRLNDEPAACRCDPGQRTLTTVNRGVATAICLACYRETTNPVIPPRAAAAIAAYRHAEAPLPESHRRGVYPAAFTHEAPLPDLSPALQHVATRTSKTDRIRVRISDLREVRSPQDDADEAHQREYGYETDGFWICFGALLALFLFAGGIVALALAMALP